MFYENFPPIFGRLSNGYTYCKIKIFILLLDYGRVDPFLDQSMGSLEFKIAQNILFFSTEKIKFECQVIAERKDIYLYT